MGTDTEENERWVPSCRYTVVKDVEYRSFVVDAYFESGCGVERNVANEHTESDRNQKHGLKVLFNGEPYKEQTYRQHDKMLPGAVVEACELPELL